MKKKECLMIALILFNMASVVAQSFNLEVVDAKLKTMKRLMN